jgi:hypothetical protein
MVLSFENVFCGATENAILKIRDPPPPPSENAKLLAERMVFFNPLTTQNITYVSIFPVYWRLHLLYIYPSPLNRNP